MTRVRNEVWGLGAGWNTTLFWYAKGVRELQSRPITDPTSWWFLAAMHGFHPMVWETYGILASATPLPSTAVQRRFWEQCQHQTWYFLPWHRGYLSAFELIVLDAIVKAGGPPDWALPYWDYSDPDQPNARRLPDAFAAATMQDGTSNPLRVDRRYGSGSTPLELDTRVVELKASDDDRFTGGANDIPPGFGGPETLFHHGPESQTTNGGLEAAPHNVIHGAIGGVRPGTNPNRWQNWGLMSHPISAGADPIFWLHHANIDRLWSVWLNAGHTNETDTNWLDGPADRQFVMPKVAGGEWVFTAREVLDTTAAPLDYRYEREAPAPAPARRVRRLTQLGVRVTAPVGGQTREAVSVTNTKAELMGASDGEVRITGWTSAAVRLDPAATQPLRNSLTRAAAATGPARTEPPRVFLKLEGIRGTSDAAIYHVYIDLPPGAEPTQFPDRRAGTISLFGVSAATDQNGPNAGSGINQVMEITEIVDALHLGGDELERLDVRFMPATPQVADADFTIGRLSVYKLEA